MAPWKLAVVRPASRASSCRQQALISGRRQTSSLNCQLIAIGAWAASKSPLRSSTFVAGAALITQLELN